MITVKNQKFGVEIEFTGITRSKAANVVAEYFGTGSPSGRNDYNVRDGQNRIWKVVYDGSIETLGYGDSYRCELVSPILQYDDIEVIQEILRQLRAAGAKVNSSCGIHVHVDGANHTPTSLKNVVNFMCARQDLIYDALGVYNNRINYCKKICKELVKKIKKTKDLSRADIARLWYSRANHNYHGGIDTSSNYNNTRYQCLNLHSYFNKGTVEFRMFNATTHAGELKAYIQFSLAVSAWAINSSDNILFKNISNYTPEQKVTNMVAVLTGRLGMTGTEFKTARFHFIKNLKAQAVA